MLIEGQVERGLTLGSREIEDKCFLYLLQKKNIALLNDYVLEPRPKYLCLCIQTRDALSLFAVTTLNARDTQLIRALETSGY